MYSRARKTLQIVSCLIPLLESHADSVPTHMTEDFSRLPGVSHVYAHQHAGKHVGHWFNFQSASK